MGSGRNGFHIRQLVVSPSLFLENFGETIGMLAARIVRRGFARPTRRKVDLAALFMTKGMVLRFGLATRGFLCALVLHESALL